MQEKSRINIAIFLSFVLVMIAIVIWAVQNGGISINADIIPDKPVFRLTSSYCENGMQVNEFSWTSSSFTPYTLFVRGTDKGMGIDQLSATTTTAKWKDKATCYNGVEQCYKSNSTLYFDLLAGNTVNQSSYVWGTCTGASCVATCPVCPVAHNAIAVPKIDCSQSPSPTPTATSTSTPATSPTPTITSTTSSQTVNTATQSTASTSSVVSTTSKPNIVSLVSTGKSLWFNLAIALVAAAIISYLLLRRRRDY